MTDRITIDQVAKAILTEAELHGKHWSPLGTREVVANVSAKHPLAEILAVGVVAAADPEVRSPGVLYSARRFNERSLVSADLGPACTVCGRPEVSCRTVAQQLGSPHEFTERQPGGDPLTKFTSPPPFEPTYLAGVRITGHKARAVLTCSCGKRWVGGAGALNNAALHADLEPLYDRGKEHVIEATWEHSFRLKMSRRNWWAM